MLPTGTVTFLMTDVEGSTRLWESAPEVMGSAIARHYEILDAEFGAHGGVRPQEQGEGDSVVAVFTDPADAVAAAIGAQRALGTEPWPGSIDLRVRMALHTGQAQLRDEANYDGPTIIRCARLRACAWGGQVVLSDATAVLVRNRLEAGAVLAPLGPHRLKDLDGSERVHQLVVDGLLSSFPPLRSLTADRHNLPSPVTPLIGREDDLAALVALVLTERVVTVTGAGGVGKTRLALQVGREVVDKFEGGVWWIDLAVVTEPDQVAAAMLTGVGGRAQPFTTLTDQLVTVLRPERLVVLLDNCEHLTERVTDVVATIIGTCSDVVVFATSREPLGVHGEVTWRLASLSVPDDDALRLDAVNTSDALQLFWDRARRARPQLDLTDAMVAASAQICRRLDGIPLAIELAAARCRQFPPERIARELSDHYRLVSTGGRGQLPRQRTIEASIDWSYQLLAPTEQMVFRRLGVFIGWFPLNAAEAVVSSFGDLAGLDAVDVVGRLVDKSLLILGDDSLGGEPLYRMLDTVRRYAVDQARQAGEADALQDNAADWWSQWAGGFPGLVVELGSGLDELDVMYPNLRASLSWLGDNPARAAALVQHLAPVFAFRGHEDDFRAVARPVAMALYRERAESWIDVVSSLALVAVTIGDLEFVFGPVQEALDTARQAGDDANAALCLSGLGFLDASARTWAQLEETGRRLGSEPVRAAGASIYAACVTRDLAVDLDALSALIEMADLSPFVRVSSLLSRANILFALGRLEDIEATFHECLAIREANSNPSYLLWTLATGAAQALYRNDDSDIDVIARRATARSLRGAMLMVAGQFQQTIAIALHQLRQLPLDTATLTTVASMPIAPTPWREGYALIARQLLDLELDDSVDVLHRSLTASPLVETPFHQLITTTIAARLAELREDADPEETWQRLLILADEQGAARYSMDALEGIGGATAATRPEYAATLLGCAQQGRDSTGYRFRFPKERRRVDQAVATTVQLLGDREASETFDTGRTLTLPEAAAYAGQAGTKTPPA